jgi:hypothetical protein
MVGVNMDIPGNLEARASVRPDTVQALQFGRRYTLRVRQPFGHRGFCYSVVEYGPTGQLYGAT